jgi:hypothetical protein
MTIDQISVFVENGAGKLVGVTRVLGEANVDIRAMSIAETADFGILRMIVSDPVRAIEALKFAGNVVSVTQVLAVEIEDKPGSLSEVLAVIEKAEISVEYIYAFITRKSDNAYVIFRVEDVDKANEALAEAGIKTAGPHELYDL